ncbi:hypothetical protein MAM1_1263d11544 [Mucor ambiguus]|uniref:Uncharacterized protein n=1 Tax=Mucor ambiguus TaxID=91626 RepID=A0A0C9NAW8_9FUNG|nr:hypothetical protein MAM1_1263d11544 [Mucor ambiguus]
MLRTQQTSLSYINKQGGTRSLPLLDIVSTPQYHDTSATHTRKAQYDSRQGITVKILQEPMANTIRDFSTTQPSMETFSTDLFDDRTTALLPSSAQDHPETSCDGYSGGTLLAQRNMVSISTISDVEGPLNFAASSSPNDVNM